MPHIEACVVFEHNLYLVAVAAAVCVFGAWVALGLFERASQGEGVQQWGWLLLTAISAGASIWCTHFVGILAYDPGVPVAFEPRMTIASAQIATIGAAAALAVALMKPTRVFAPVGGALLGLSIAAMHYSGMLAYRVVGLVDWSLPTLVASLVIASGFGAASIHVFLNAKLRRRRPLSVALLVAAILGLHFTGIAALKITPLQVEIADANGDAALTLALAVVSMSVLIVGTGLVSHLIDQDVRASTYRRLRELALHDGLTRLPNRTFFLEKVEDLIAEATRAAAGVALFAIDLSGLKEVNDQYGQGAGDAVLEGFAERLRKALAPGEVGARLGGDEFAVAQASRGRGDVENLAGRLAAIFLEPIAASEFVVKIGANMGAAVFPEDAGGAGGLLNNAALAMYRSKSEQSDEVCFYERSMDEQVRANRRMATELREAIHDDELEVHYQVQTSCETGAIMGFEALARWQRHGGFTPPVEFIPVAEQYGLIDALGDWVLRKACAEAARWDPPYRIAVNLSPLQLTHPDLPQSVAAILRETGLPPSRLELELTESALIRDAKSSLKVLRQIRELGVTLALDDFGTGFSSLSTLRVFPFDKIKLDRSFLREIETSAKAASVLEAVLGLGKGLDIVVLTEGVETQGQLDMLRAKGCAQAQGYLIGKPAPMSRLEADGLIRTLPKGREARAAA